MIFLTPCITSNCHDCVAQKRCPTATHVTKARNQKVIGHYRNQYPQDGDESANMRLIGEFKPNADVVIGT